MLNSRILKNGLALVVGLCAIDAWAAADPTVHDPGSFVQRDLIDLSVCSCPYEPTHVTGTGHAIKMLGAAFVYMGPSNGRSAFGHVGERFVYCRDTQVFDVLYDYAPTDVAKIESDFRDQYRLDSAQYSRELLQSYAESLYVNLVMEPVKAYAEQQFYQNRTIFEAWFDTDEQVMYQMLLANTKRYRKQEKVIRDRQPLPEYRLLGNNCTLPVREDLALVNPAYLRKFDVARLTPSFLFNTVKKQPLKKLIAYPSQRVFRLLELKKQGKGTAFENFAPFSRASKGAASDSWVLLYPDAKSRSGKIMLTPLAGALNTVAGAAETAYGIATLPLNLLGRIPGLKFLHSKKRGWHRITSGMRDILLSLGEIAFIRTRYPHSTPWTEEEKRFFTDYSQNSVLLDFLEAEHAGTELVVEGSGRFQPEPMDH